MYSFVHCTVHKIHCTLQHKKEPNSEGLNGKILKWRVPLQRQRPLAVVPYRHLHMAQGFLYLYMREGVGNSLDLQSLFGLHVHSFTHWLRPSNFPPIPPHLGSYTRALLVSQDRPDLVLILWGVGFIRFKLKLFVKRRWKTSYNWLNIETIFVFQKFLIPQNLRRKTLNVRGSVIHL